MNASRVIKLWPDGCPNNPTKSDEPPYLELYLPEKRVADTNCPAVIVCPGGGYGGLAPHEGTPFAELFTRQGLVAFVLMYRTAPDHRFPAPYADCCRAMRLVREMSEELGLDPQRIGLMGFSAGGHLVSTVSTQPELYRDPNDDLADKWPARPNRLILGYPVISFVSEGHMGSAMNLLGGKASQEELEKFSNELHVTADNPPVFAFHTADDEMVHVSNATRFISACQKAGVKTELHIFEHGRHGVGLAEDDPKLKPWTDLLLAWMSDWLA